ncbi:hypothetical protein DPEC_G00154010 [Dallia pectoralis]|uniref:Uncharacterized protein n=1 Tax=Dallia pectoralis TaxID=75939 RepID=A0ACC2GK45_DALPE|nr:hypothetical protein DPEC_G00154010 [Dallia pectoralis]
MQVTWQKESPAGNVNVATYSQHFGVKVNSPFKGKVEFLYVGLQNCSIVIRRVSREDESCYTCLFNTYYDESVSGRTCLKANELYGPTLLVTQTTESNNLVSGLTASCCATGQPIVSSDSNCANRVTLQTEKGGVFLHISNIQPSDEGNYICECVYNGGTDVLYLNITVNESAKSEQLAHSIHYVVKITCFATLLAVIFIVHIILSNDNLRTAVMSVCRSCSFCSLATSI